MGVLILNLTGFENLLGLLTFSCIILIKEIKKVGGEGILMFFLLKKRRYCSKKYDL